MRERRERLGPIRNLCAGGAVKRGNVCYGMLRAAACVDESDHALMYVLSSSVRGSLVDLGLRSGLEPPWSKGPFGCSECVQPKTAHLLNAVSEKRNVFSFSFVYGHGFWRNYLVRVV